MWPYIVLPPSGISAGIIAEAHPAGQTLCFFLQRTGRLPSQGSKPNAATVINSVSAYRTENRTSISVPNPDMTRTGAVSKFKKNGLYLFGGPCKLDVDESPSLISFSYYIPKMFSI